MKAKEMCLTALMTALMCIVGPLTVPVGMVPVTLVTLAVYLAGALLGARRGTAAVGLYILIGMAGLPVFAGGSMGIHCLTGVTGGFIAGYLPCAWVVGFCTERWGEKRWVWPAAMLLGTALCYGAGAAWFMLHTKLGLSESLAACVLPFLPADGVKIILACIAGSALKRRLATI